MPEIDIRTLFYLFSAGNFFMLIFFWIYIFLTKESLPIINIFIVSNILLSIAWVLYALRNQIPDFYSIPVANVLLIFAVCYAMYVIIFIRKETFNKHFLRFNIIPILFSLVFLSFLNASENTRVIVSSSILAFIYLLSSLLLFRAISNSKMLKLAGIFSFIIAILFLLRAIYALFIEKNMELYSSNMQVIPIIFHFLTSISWAIILLLILKEIDVEHIRQDNLKLNELNRSKDRFFSIIAHDLRGPIGALTQLGQALLEENDNVNAAYRQKIIDMIIDSSKRTFNLLENLLQWARSESGRLKIEKDKINLNDIVANNILLSSEHLRQKKIKVQFDNEVTNYAFADCNMIETVVRNILTNAVKFTRENGVIEVYFDATQDKKIVLCIRDNGVGIDSKYLPKLFDLDFVLKTKGTNNEKGTGIGLKLCKEFVEKNGGQIFVTSTLGKGSTFCISLPKFTPEKN